MISSEAPREPDQSAKSSQEFHSQVLEIDAALHKQRPPALSDSLLSRLSAEERRRLAHIQQQMELLTAKSLLTGQPPTTTAATRLDQGSRTEDESNDPEISINLPALLGIQESQFGRFEVIRALGMGGHGVVFLARDPVLDRLVALKIPRPDVLVNPSMQRRFLQEGRAAALLTHPHIVSVFESGEAGGICYLAQDYIPGPSLAVWLKDHPDPVAPSVAARLILQLAEAAAFAHSRQILHRDIKPGNILLAPLTSAESPARLEDFVPKLTDFGVAKLMQAEDQTRTGAMVGTPGYMSPEQAVGREAAVGVTSDLYSLGTVLYELLTHQPLFRGETALDTVHQVIHRDPPHPRTTIPGTPRDLDAICMKCLCRESADRYPSAQELADDLRRFLEGRPVVARPQSWITSISRMSRRNPAIALLSAAVAVTVLTMLVGSLWFNARLQESLSDVAQFNAQLKESLKTVRQQEQDLEARTLVLRKRVYADDLRQAAHAWQEGKAAEVRKRLAAWLPESGEPDLRSFPWWMLSHRIEQVSQVIGTIDPGTISAAVAVSPAGDLVACGEPDGVIRLRSLPDGRVTAELRGHAQGPINALHFAPFAGGSRLVSASDDGTVRIWDRNTQQALHVLDADAGRVMAVCFLGKEGEAVAAGGEDHLIRIWDGQSGQLLSQIAGHTDIVRSLVEQTGTGILFSSAEDQTIRAWDWRAAKSDPRLHDGQLTIPRDAGWARRLALNPGETDLAAGFRTGRLVVWNVHGKHPQFSKVQRDHLFASGVRALTWADDETLVVGLADSRILIGRDIGKSVDFHEVLPGHEDWVLSADVVLPQKDVVSISKDGTIRRWPGSEINGQIVIPSAEASIAAHPLWNETALTCVMRGEVFGFDPQDGRQRFKFGVEEMRSGGWCCLSNDGTRFLTVAQTNEEVVLTSVRVDTGARDWQLPLGNLNPTSGTQSPDGKQIFLPMNEALWTVEAETGRRGFVCKHPKAVTDVHFLPQTATVITACMDGNIRFWDVATGQLMREHAAHQNSAQKLAVSRNGQLLATAGEDLWVRVWRIADWQVLASFGLNTEISSVYFLEEDRTLLTFNDDTLTFWNIPDQIELLRWTSIPKGASIVPSPDQTALAIQNGRVVRLIRGAP